MRRIALDTETTGLNPSEGHRIVEIGCVELDENIPTGKVWHAYINPERTMPEAAFAVHGLSEEFLLKKPVFKDIVKDFMGFINGAELVIHNAKFDIGFLNAEFSRCGHPPLSMERVIDTLPLARQKYPGAQVSLDALCKRYRIDNSRRVKHTALIDCDLLSKVFINLTDQKEPTFDLKNTDQENYSDNNINSNYYKEVIKPTADELKKHDLYLSRYLKKNHFN